MKSKKRYLDSVPIEDALRLWLQAIIAAPTGAETVAVPDSPGRVLAEPVTSVLSSPHYHAAAMDGIAVNAKATFGASETRPVRLTRPSEFVWVDTGDPLPPDKDSVIMSEDLEWISEDTVEIIAAATPWQHVRPIGEDIVATELLFAKGHTIRPVDIGALLAAGIWEVAVRKKPVVALIPTGDEIVELRSRLAEGSLRTGDIIESNAYVQKAVCESWGACPVRFDIVPDDKALLSQALDKALSIADVVVINAGSSAGSEDFTLDVIRDRGEVLVHGVAQRPGKPVILGRASCGGKWKPVVGIPGYPVSSYLTFHTFVRPVVRSMLGLAHEIPETVEAGLTRKVASTAGVEEFLRVKVGKVGERLIASPISRGAGVITSLVRADGIVRIPRLQEGLAEGSTVRVHLTRPLHEVLNTVVVIGSHDPGLDLLGSIMRATRGVGLSSSHAGSIGGLLALRRGEAHAAGIHLIDESDGTYNTSYVKRMLPGHKVLLVTLAHRHQGLMVRPGNPAGIRGIEDLARGDVRFVNRQRGAGTRILLDLFLARLGIDPSSVSGYEHEEYTHTQVAAQVASGVADCALGVLAAARALRLDFIPVTRETYELAILDGIIGDPRVEAMLCTMRLPEFKAALASLGGYDTDCSGDWRWCENA